MAYLRSFENVLYRTAPRPTWGNVDGESQSDGNFDVLTIRQSTARKARSKVQLPRGPHGYLMVHQKLPNGFNPWLTNILETKCWNLRRKATATSVHTWVNLWQWIWDSDAVTSESTIIHVGVRNSTTRLLLMNATLLLHELWKGPRLFVDFPESRSPPEGFSTNVEGPHLSFFSKVYWLEFTNQLNTQLGRTSI